MELEEFPNMTDQLNLKKPLKPKRAQGIYQFKITLLDISPPIWRRIQVPDYYSFWDLHVAITDCMPWLDYHLHAFKIKHPKTGKLKEIGIPDDDGELEHEPGWKHDISKYFTAENNKALYEYDFGDGWEHEILFEGASAIEPGVAYPRCIDGRRACPPEDVGGTGGYADFLNTILDLHNPERKSMLEWAKSLTGKPDFDPEAFDPAKLYFDNPAKRWGVAFNDEELTPDMRCHEFFKNQ
jgi:hypothetical protein